jgi:hypothetical protein
MMDRRTVLATGLAGAAAAAGGLGGCATGAGRMPPVADISGALRDIMA